MTLALKLRFADIAADASPREVTIVFESGAMRHSVSFRSSGPALRQSGDVLLCLGLVPAVELNCDLVLGSPVDGRLLANAEKIQAILCRWYPGYRPVRIVAEACHNEYPAERGQALFFSGGVDSSFSLAEAQKRLSALVTVIGADVDLGNSEEVRYLSDASKQVAAAYDLQTVLIETDLRRVSDRLVGWVEYHGSALAAIRHLLADRFENVLIASSADESSWKRPWGSHPALDPLFGIEAARIEHHGLVHRLAKIERILAEPVLMESLRVCDYSHENCGVCEDCAFMVKSLAALDAQLRAPTFPLMPQKARRLVVTGEGSRSDLINLQRHARERGNAGLAREIDLALAWYRCKKRIFAVLPLPWIKRRFKRFKRRLRYRRATHRG